LIQEELEKLANEIAEKANEYCNQTIRGYISGDEEDICAIALKALEKAVSLPRWIDIRDQEPPKGKPVLITDGKVRVVSFWIGQGKRALSVYSGPFPSSPEDPPSGKLVYCIPFAEYIWEGYGFGGPEWEWTFKNFQITHWMPLPELPVKEVITDDSKR